MQIFKIQYLQLEIAMSVLLKGPTEARGEMWDTPLVVEQVRSCNAIHISPASFLKTCAAPLPVRRRAPLSLNIYYFNYLFY
jgi:hypothetical protein